MSHCLGARVPGGKDCRRDDSNNLEDPRLSCEDRDECAGDNGGEEETQFAK